MTTGLTIDYNRLGEAIATSVASYRSPLAQLEPLTVDGMAALPVTITGDGKEIAMPDQRIVDTLNDNFKTNHVLLQGIIDGLGDVGGVSLLGNTSLLDSLKSGAGKLTDMLSSYYSGVASIAGKGGRCGNRHH